MNAHSNAPHAKKKVLYIATVVKTHIMTFHIPFLKMLKEMGYETAVAARNDYENPEDCQIPYCDTFYDIPFERSPFSPQNIKAYTALKKVIASNHFDIIHCHTPMGSVIGRICAIPKRKKGTKVFYTAHGFHFYKGAPLKNWLLYYPMEWICSFFTDTLITINREDFTFSQKALHARRNEYVPGVGIDVDKFAHTTVDRSTKRAELGIPADCTLLTSVGELNKNKNHEVVIRALAALKDPTVHYLIVGKGKLREYLSQLTDTLGLESQVHFGGYRSDIAEVYKASDICVFPSVREGLGIAAIEGMACGLPLIASNNRGTQEYAFHLKNAILCPHDSVDSYFSAIKTLAESQPLRCSFSTKNIAIAKKYDLSEVIQIMQKLYDISYRIEV